MPIYEYDCADCRRTVSLLVLRPSSAPEPVCPRCGGGALTRVLSRFVRVRSDAERLDALADSPMLDDVDENDPAGMARLMRTMGQELGEDMDEELEAAMDEGADGGADGDTEFGAESRGADAPAAGEETAAGDGEE